MTQFEKKAFQKFKFEDQDIKRYLDNSLRDLKIAKEDPFPEVRFTYSYQALIKLGIALIAKVGQVKVRSIPGHHIQILSKASEILRDNDVLAIGNAMRMKRNFDFYGGGESVTKKEADDYFGFVHQLLKKATKSFFESHISG